MLTQPDTMPKIPSLKPKEVIRVLRKVGFEERNTTGSHMILRHPVTHKIAVVPVHGGYDIKKGTFRNILKQADLSVDDFLKLL